MRLQSMSYNDDDKVETRIKFSDDLTFVIAAPVTVTIEGYVPDDVAEAIESLRREFERRVSKEIDFALFQTCIVAIRAAMETEEASA